MSEKSGKYMLPLHYCMLCAKWEMHPNNILANKKKKFETNTMKYVWIESNCVNDWRYDSCFDSVWMNWCISQKIMCAVGTHAFYVIERAKKTHTIKLLLMFCCCKCLCALVRCAIKGRECFVGLHQLCIKYASTT